MGAYKDEYISMSYGNGGKKTSNLIQEMLLPCIGNEYLNPLADGALVPVSEKIAFSTDSFVIDPYFFPGGDIGKLSICGTVNDLLMCGSIPRFLSLAFILEEGFKIKDLEAIIKSIGNTARSAGIKIVTGDTKVVDKGHGHGIYINTSGIGEKRSGLELSTQRIKAGDKIILSGSAGNHGIAVLCARENLLDHSIQSDCAIVKELVEVIVEYGKGVKILRDPTRGGVATTLNEFVEGLPYSIELEEQNIPIDCAVRGACEILGLDPLYSANEGKVLAVVSKQIAEEVVDKLKQCEQGRNAAIIGEVLEENAGKVVLKTSVGGKRILGKIVQDALPRIC